MPIPKRSTTPKKVVKETIYTHPDLHDNSAVSKSNNSENGPGFGKIGLIILGVIILIVIINAVVNNSSSSNSYYSYNNTSSSSYNYNTSSSSYNYDTSSSTTANSYEKNGKCKGSDGGRYEKPLHGYCDGGKTPLGWKCDAGYYAKSENDKTRIDSSWYCAANCENFNCVGYGYIPCTSEQQAIPTYVNQYSQASIDNYNAKIEAYNRCLSEKCSCNK